MRVSDRTIARNYLSYLYQAKDNYAQIQQRIASSHRFEKISDDVSSGNRVLNIRMEKYKTEKYLDNIQSVNDKLTMVEDTMRSIHDLNVRVYEQLGLQAQNTSTGETGRLAIADEIKSIREEIRQFTNTMYNGSYLFGGSNAMGAPFELGEDGKVTYNGVDVDLIQKKEDGTLFYLDADGNEQIVPMDEDIFLDLGLGIVMQGSDVDPDTAFQINYSGLDVFGFGTTDYDGDPVTTDDLYSNNFYNVLTDMEEALRNNDMTRFSELNTHLKDLNEDYFGHVTELGAKTKYLESLETRYNTTVDSYDARINELMGTNMAEEATNQTTNDAVLKAILQMGANLLPVSLMDFLA